MFHFLALANDHPDNTPYAYHELANGLRVHVNDICIFSPKHHKCTSSTDFRIIPHQNISSKYMIGPN